MCHGRSATQSRRIRGHRRTGVSHRDHAPNRGGWRSAARGVTVYFIAGEASGDSRGAELMLALRERLPDLQFAGAGGPKMKAIAGGDFFDWAHEAVVGIWDVLKKYGYFRRQF